ncbi:hypothetical protein [Acinetobacter rudis]|uniref:SCP2 domain-containing protein n=1 Tax=Acinetobacter rudis TaxID=632955 RepID=A0AAW8J7J1_9GAMM|nr:hypothetical protein [Acinetobacter rudis]MDQ8936027.1 hypothetical protein [Acinetobacter rudis]MDQ8953873.1 hypothetical protein [Acinetobacter rudis]MDQ9018290.1 hypothetical protein [Acinetobacter rudis]
MNESQHQQSQTRWLPNILMIILETLFSFTLKHDRLVSLQSQPFIDRQLTLKINSYLPYFNFYVQFTDKGVLFDVQAPDQPVDLTINSTMIELIRIFLMGNTRAIRKLRFEGDLSLKAPMRDLFLQLSLPKLLSDWHKWFRQPDNTDLSTASQNRIRPLLQTIENQRIEIQALKDEVEQHKQSKRQLKTQIKYFKFAITTISLLFIIIVVYNLLRIF